MFSPACRTLSQVLKRVWFPTIPGSVFINKHISVFLRKGFWCFCSSSLRFLNILCTCFQGASEPQAGVVRERKAWCFAGCMSFLAFQVVWRDRMEDFDHKRAKRPNAIIRPTLGLETGSRESWVCHNMFIFRLWKQMKTRNVSICPGYVRFNGSTYHIMSGSAQVCLPGFQS